MDWFTLTVDEWDTLTVDEWDVLPVQIEVITNAGGGRFLQLNAFVNIGAGKHVQFNSYTSANAGRFLLANQVTQAGTGLYGILQPITQTHGGVSAWITIFINQSGPGIYKYLVSPTMTGAGRHSLEPRVLVRQVGGGRFNSFFGFKNVGGGRFTQFKTYTSQAGGRFKIAISITQQGSGRFLLGLFPITSAGAGRHQIQIAITQSAKGGSRVANDALDRFELYIGVDGPPDFDADPAETFTSLPHETAPFANGFEFQVVVRKRNIYTLISRNIQAFIFSTDGVGDLEATRPAEPENTLIAPALAGAVNVTSTYFYLKDGINQASQFLVYLTDTGVDPDPGVDSPVVVDMVKVDGIAKLNLTSATFSDDDTIKALVRVRRIDPGPVNVDSDNLNIVQTIADVDGPPEPPGGIFFGIIAEQSQG